MTRVSLCFYGAAKPQGSKRIGRNPATGKPILLDASPASRLYRHGLTEKMLEIAPPQPWDCPVSVTLRIYVPRPKAHWRTGKHAGELKDGMPALPGSGLDIDKVARLVSDAGTGVLWRDDARIAHLDVRRLWADECPECIELEAMVLE